MKAFVNAILGRSKTINFGALLVALIPVLKACGVTIPDDAARVLVEFGPAVIGAIVIALRAVTGKPLAEK